jgi:hypothetical protein
VLAAYADWRLLPGSPLQDIGRFWPSNGFSNGMVYSDGSCDHTQLDKTDGEGHGNPRTRGASIDLGFDELHLAIMAGSYANEDTSHNRPTPLNPSALAAQPHRYAFLPRTPNGQPIVGATVEFRDVERVVPAIPPFVPPAWRQPPVTLDPPLLSYVNPVGYRTQYISFGTTSSVSDPWTTVIDDNQHKWPWSNPMGVPDPLLVLRFQFYRLDLPADDEGAGFASWFNTQSVIDLGGGTPQLWGNLQPEYR